MHSGWRTTCTRSHGASSCTGSSGRWRPTTGEPPAMPPAATRSRRPAQGATDIRSRSTRSRCRTSRRSVDLALKEFAEIKPDLSLELRIPSIRLSFDLLVELDLTSRPSYNRDKLLAYDAFLCGWSLAHPRYQTQGTRPAVVFVCSDARAVLALAQEADEAMTGRIGVMGTGPEHWYHAGRDHGFFAVEGRHPPRRPARAGAARPPTRTARAADRNARAGTRARGAATQPTWRLTRDYRLMSSQAHVPP